MIGPDAIHSAATFAREGSPTLLHSVGRLAGLGQNETQQLLGGKLPAVLWIGGGVALGWFIGVKAQKHGWARGWLSESRS